MPEPGFQAMSQSDNEVVYRITPGTRARVTGAVTVRLRSQQTLPVPVAVSVWVRAGGLDINGRTNSSALSMSVLLLPTTDTDGGDGDLLHTVLGLRVLLRATTPGYGQDVTHSGQAILARLLPRISVDHLTDSRVAAFLLAVATHRRDRCRADLDTLLTTHQQALIEAIGEFLAAERDLIQARHIHQSLPPDRPTTPTDG